MYDTEVFDTEVCEAPPESFDELDLGPPARELLDLESAAGGIPSGVDAMAADRVLAVFLSTVDPSSLSGHDLVLFLRAQQRLVSHVQARFYAGVAALGEAMHEFEDDFELANDAAAMELRAALRLTRRMAGMELDFAHELTTRLPKVAQAFEAGRIDIRRARVLVNGTIHLEQRDARRVVDRIIDRAGELTTGELRARVHKLCIEVEPAEADYRYKFAHEDRKLVVDPTLSGTADIHLTGTDPHKASAGLDRINTIAKTLRGPGEERTMDQLRADIAIDLLCGNPTYQKATGSKVVVNVDLDTLARLTEMPGDLAGYGPVIADIARQTAEQTGRGEWQYRVTHPDSGQTVAAGVTRKRRHNTHQRREVELRDPVCVFPGCRTPSTSCDIDHIETWAETGQTTINHSAPMDRHDHTGRHNFGWTYFRLPDGDYLWVSPLGHYYTKSGRPPPELN